MIRFPEIKNKKSLNDFGKELSDFFLDESQNIKNLAII